MERSVIRGCRCRETTVIPDYVTPSWSLHPGYRIPKYASAARIAMNHNATVETA
jgi:hypothetical protein